MNGPSSPEKILGGFWPFAPRAQPPVARAAALNGHDVTDYLSQPVARRLAYGLLLFLLAWVLLTFSDYGFSFDESPGNVRGVRLWNYYFSPSGGKIPYDVKSFYGWMPDFLAVVTQNVIPGIGFEARHLVSGLFGFAGIFYTYKVGGLISRTTGLLSLIFLAVNPMWNGYMFFNLKDIPLASLIMATFYYFALVYTGKDRGYGAYLGLAISAGLLASTKLIGVAIAGAFCFLAICTYATSVRERRIAIDFDSIRRMIAIVFTVIVGCLVVLSVFWPQIYVFTPSQLIVAFNKFVNFDSWTGSTLLNGVQYGWRGNPRYYMITYLTIQMPLFLLALVVGSLYALYRRPHPVAFACLGFIVLFLSYQAISHTRVYGGFRHFLFLIPPAMVLGAYAAELLLKAASHVRVGAVAVVVALAGATLYTGIQVFRLSPYQYSFYNSLVGGLRGADGLYYIDPWRTAAKEPLEALVEIARTSGTRPVVFTCATALNSKVFRKLDLVGLKDKPSAEYVVTTRRGCPIRADLAIYPPIVLVERDGVVFSSLHRVKPAAPDPVDRTARN